ncbi:GNAT family N-acetyltransferase [Aliiroseovarius sp. KMU-50]|uniref:acyl-homoserine-lactone synthase n=1 Tax=Aliiroseovarius salicola TaxID=3009082 RepID=A0ABT4W2B4_9RHOB|nr:acyl-homoserine-lactone synthase [Aliiroseovarius sp. KMU-50]MDA5094642.1 GNAT family N-acetyltransferase [Aliiroseovarius sp. KMU-50]
MGQERVKTAGVFPAWSVFPELEPADGGVTQISEAKPVSKSSGNFDFPIPKTEAHVKTTTLSFSTIHQHGELYVNCLKARKAVFIDQLGWDLPETEGMEFDQYDTPECRWVIVHEYGEVLGGVRLAPTTAKCGIYTYMLRDAQLGLLDNIPTDVLYFEAPVDEKIWEASRLFIASDVPAQRRHGIQSILMDAMSKSAYELGANHVIGIVPYVFSRWLRRLNLSAVAVGSKFKIDRTSSQAALFTIRKSFH